VRMSRLDRVLVRIPLTATDLDGEPVELTDVGVALVAPWARPGALVTWQPVEPEDGFAEVLLTGPDAAMGGALTAPPEGASLYVRVADTPEVIVRKVLAVIVD
jgi:hypothetical protein